MVRNLNFFVFPRIQTLRMHIWNRTIVFSNSSLKKCIFGPNFKDFYFAPKFAIRQIRWSLFQIWQSFFPIPVRKYPNKAVFILNVSTFYCCMKNSSRIEKLKGTDFKNGNSFFQIISKKYPNTKFSLTTQTNFFLSETFSELSFI